MTLTENSNTCLPSIIQVQLVVVWDNCPLRRTVQDRPSLCSVPMMYASMFSLFKEGDYFLPSPL